jgi:hypothetical protein
MKTIIITTFNRRRPNWTTCLIALTFFCAGSFVASRLSQPRRVQADADRIFELRIYHALPGKLPALESQFRDTTSKLLAKHNLNVVGYWVSGDDGAAPNSFIWVLAHASREEAKKNWDAFRADPAFQQIIKSEQTDKRVEKIDFTYMRPTDFSALK